MNKIEREKAEIIKARQALYGYGDERDNRVPFPWLRVMYILLACGLVIALGYVVFLR